MTLMIKPLNGHIAKWNLLFTPVVTTPALTFKFQRQSPLHSSLAPQDPRLVAIPNLITLLNLFTLDHVDASRAEPILYS